jgi:hypothetical protein
MRYICSGSNLYYQDASCKQSFVEACLYGCAGGGCLAPPVLTAAITAVPTLVRSGGTSQISWSASNVISCTVSGTNGDSWSGASGSKTSSPIVARTTYTLICHALPGASPSSLTETQTVNIVPQFQER